MNSDLEFWDSEIVLLCYHGTSKENAEKIRTNNEWKASEPEIEWLGKKVYILWKIIGFGLVHGQRMENIIIRIHMF
ncbi:hypothetical protein [Marinitoga aeolica]|uniref:Uncharacterized protein n=1 Tax=Marinitoga aeolica TaxID=2809031 RepID=A0ABY8PPU9_9BACT|nr:hypothetical protein [Marinitoga aeolica]WGS64651.1 hypothetical protein JRV97_09835 [Marinitoga aeolica]